jgi:hypothetical protein
VVAAAVAVTDERLNKCFHEEVIVGALLGDNERAKQTVKANTSRLIFQ